MHVSNKQRPWVCALPQPGWGGSTLAGYIETIGMRPDASGTDQEVAEVLDLLVKSGFARTIEVDAPLPEDAEEGTLPEKEVRWELTEEGHDALVAEIEPEAGASAAEVMLELQPGVPVSGTSAEVN